MPINTRLDAFNQFMCSTIKGIVVENTNKYLKKQEEDADFRETELDAWLSLLLAAGATNQNKTKVTDLWSKDGPLQMDIFGATMTRNRLLLILRVIRFDDKDTRQERQETDRLAAIRNVADTFAKNCRTKFYPSPHLCVDERMVSYRNKTNSSEKSEPFYTVISRLSLLPSRQLKHPSINSSGSMLM
jgi:hypothetical protein